MSHHLESPLSREDGRVDLTDMFVFPGEQPATTVLIMNVNPDAGLTSPTTFRADALYDFRIDTDGDALENTGLRIRFGEPAPDTAQAITLYRVRYTSAQEETEEVLASGHTNEVIQLNGGGRMWAGLAGDPFFADAFALDTFQNAIFGNDRLDLSAFGKRTFVFGDGRNVSSIVLELPNSEFPAEQVGIWATTTIWKDGERLQINRYGKPLINILFLRQDDHLVEHYNRSHPRDDQSLYRQHIAKTVSRLTELGKTASDPAAYGQRVVELLLPDVLPYRINTAASYGFAGFNGRPLGEDVFDVMMSIITNQPVSDQAASNGRQRKTFPFVPPAYSEQELAGHSPYLDRNPPKEISGSPS